jgi:hypothetical protein
MISRQEKEKRGEIAHQQDTYDASAINLAMMVENSIIVLQVISSSR